MPTSSRIASVQAHLDAFGSEKCVETTRHGGSLQRDCSAIVVLTFPVERSDPSAEEACVPAKFVLRKGRTGKFTFTLEGPNGQILATSADHPNLRAAKSAIASLQRSVPGADVDDRSAGTGAAKKATARKASVRKVAAKKSVRKAATRKVAAKKTTRKVAAKKVATRKVAAKKVAARKTTAKKTTAKKTARKSAARKVAAPRKTTARKVAVKKTAARKTAAKKAVRKVAVRKVAAPRKRVARKASAG
jgi:uncharacterized protein YegP (UPF0339 family)